MAAWASASYVCSPSFSPHCVLGQDFPLFPLVPALVLTMPSSELLDGVNLANRRHGWILGNSAEPSHLLLMKLGLRQRASDRRKGLVASGCSRAAPLIYHPIELDGTDTSLVHSEVDSGDFSKPTSDILRMLIYSGMR